MSADSILVTGARGMIGRAVVDRFRFDGFKVKSTSRNPEAGGRIDHYWQLGTPMGDALDGVDAVVHLAGRVHVRGAGFSDEEGFVRENADFTLQLAKEAYGRGVKRFVFISSIGVLGSNLTEPRDEAAEYFPHNAYASSKFRAEQLLQGFAVSSGMELVILRPPAVIGPGIKGNVKSLVEAVKRGIPLPFSRLANQRQFVALGDLVSAISLAVSHEKAAGQLFHVANPERVSTSDLCNFIASELGVVSRLWSVPPNLLRAVFVSIGRRSLADGLTGDMLVNADKISTVLGWQPRQSIRTALGHMISSFE